VIQKCDQKFIENPNFGFSDLLYWVSNNDPFQSRPMGKYGIFSKISNRLDSYPVKKTPDDQPW